MELKKTTVEIELELWREVQKVKVDRDCTFGEAVEAGLRLWLGKSGTKDTIASVEHNDVGGFVSVPVPKSLVHRVQQFVAFTLRANSVIQTEFKGIIGRILDEFETKRGLEPYSSMGAEPAPTDSKTTKKNSA